MASPGYVQLLKNAADMGVHADELLWPDTVDSTGVLLTAELEDFVEQLVGSRSTSGSYGIQPARIA